MLQRSWLGTLCFVSLLNDLHPTCLTHKFLDDITLSEISYVLLCKYPHSKLALQDLKKLFIPFAVQIIILLN